MEWNIRMKKIDKPLTKQWGYAFWPPRWENQTGGGIQDGLQPVLQLARFIAKIINY